MSYNPTGRARVSPSHPDAWAICDRCGFLYNHKDLAWQFDWQGPRMQNLRILVCQMCMDVPFEHNRTIILPPDPVPISNPRPEFYSPDDNPISYPAQNWDPLAIVPPSAKNSSAVTVSGNIGNITGGRGLDAAFSGLISSGQNLPSSVAIPTMGSIVGPSKKASQGALLMPSLSGLTNYIGQNWSAQPGVPNILPSVLPSSEKPDGNTVALQSFTMQAPSDQAFLAGSSAISVELDGWTGSSWSILWTGTSSGSIGETMTITLTATAQGQYYGHRVLLSGDGSHAIGVATLAFVALGEFQISSSPAVQPS